MIRKTNYKLQIEKQIICRQEEYDFRRKNEEISLGDVAREIIVCKPRISFFTSGKIDVLQKWKVFQMVY